MEKLNEEISRMLGVTKSMDELDMVTDMNADSNKFLADVKARVPDVYNRVYSIFKNRGLDAAKEYFAQYDPVVLKQKERERKSAETKGFAMAKINNMKSLMLSKAEMAELIETIVLTEDYRKACQRLNFPQLVSTNFEPKTRISQRELSFGLRITTENKYDPGPAGMLKFAADLKRNDNDAILDDIIKLKKGFASDQRAIRMAKKGGYYDDMIDHDQWLFDDRFVKMINTLRVSYGVSLWGAPSVQAGGENMTVFSIRGDEEKLVKTDHVYKSKRVSVEQMNKELVVSVIKDMLFALHQDIMRIIAKMEREAGAHDIMRKGMENPGLNERR